MKASVIVFPGSNCDRDMQVALAGCGADVTMVWHDESVLPESDLVVIPGGFSYGDYLRCGALASKSPIMREVIAHASKGGYVLGICNGFQVLTETQLVPGTLMRNRNLNFVCRDAHLKVENAATNFTNKYKSGQVIEVPIAHHDGNYVVDTDVAKALQDNHQIAFTYADESGAVNDNTNPNGSVLNIAGVFNEHKNILGMMPHPERLWEPALGGTDGRHLFDSLINSFKG
jgi:phosphoribosylformylglycinamidine synthase